MTIVWLLTVLPPILLGVPAGVLLGHIILSVILSWSSGGDGGNALYPLHNTQESEGETVSQDGDGDIQVASPALVWHAVADCLPLPYHVVFLCQADVERLDYAVGSRREDGWYVAWRPAPCPLSDFSHWLYANRPGAYLGAGDLAWAVPVRAKGKG